jgi:glycosyltransferase involved in cell wall biosynthesis
MVLADGPRVTVVIPTWNRCGLVSQAVASVVAQSYRNWELVVVDDGSTDDTVSHLEALAIPNLKIVRSPHIGHLGRLRNLGARAGSGEFLAFLDSDDLWCPMKLEQQISLLVDSSAGWSYTEYTLVSEAGVQVPLRSGKAPAISGHVVRALLREETGIPTETIMVRRSLFDAIGGFCEDARMPYRDDADFALRLARRSEVVALPETLVLVREHPGRTTRNIIAPHEHSAVAYEFFVRDEADRDLRILAQRCWARCLAKAGGERLELGDYRAAMKLYWKALTRSGLTGDWIGAAARGVRNRLRRVGSGGIASTPERP